MNYKDLKIIICGNKKEMVTVGNLLDKVELTGTESIDRLILQQFVDDNKLKTSILYDGNTIVSYNRIIAEYTNILKKNEFSKMSDYFYQFLHLDCGSIAHYDMRGWLHEYPDIESLKWFFNNNEMGTDIVRNQPSWKTDVIKITKDILKLTAGESIGTEVKTKIQIEYKAEFEFKQLAFF